MKLLINKDYLRDFRGNAILTEFTKIVQTVDGIKCYIEDSIEKEFLGINDMSIFSIEDGEFSKEEETQEQQLAKLVSNLMRDNKKKDMTIKKNEAMTKELAKMIARINLDKVSETRKVR